MCQDRKHKSTRLVCFLLFPYFLITHSLLFCVFLFYLYAFLISCGCSIQKCAKTDKIYPLRGLLLVKHVSTSSRVSSSLHFYFFISKTSFLVPRIAFLIFNFFALQLARTSPAHAFPLSCSQFVAPSITRA